MTVMPTAPTSFYPVRPAPGRAMLSESRSVPPKLTLPSPTPRPALPAPTAKAALTAVAARAGMTVDDLAAPAASPSGARASARPRALTGAAIEQRFRYWYGHSGRRYLFSEVERGEIADLEGVVLLVPGNGDTLGHVGLDPVACPASGPVFVHLLAETEAERSAIVADLAPRTA